MKKKYKLGFDIWGLVLFLIIMIPTFIWSVVPAPNDVLRVSSITKIPDMIASVCQVLMIGMLCILINRERKKLRITPFIVMVLICCLLYFASWIVYYSGVVSAIVILGLTIPPCMAFMFWAIDRKNLITVIPITIFTICHLIYGIVNFVI
ncbi:MAG: hypothetical protein NC240_08330 [Clostridium sp.]|nr:hypothetical protein [Clostridium sp.]